MWISKLVFFAIICSVLADPSYNEKNNITNTDPNFPFTGEMFTGFVVIDNATQANLYYHLYGFNQGPVNAKAPLVIWLQGGPGCASAFGNYNELGPVKILNNSDESGFVLQRNEDTWNNYAHLLFIDQPTGSGFSQAKGLNVSSTDQAASNFQVFLARFYQLFPELASNPLYLFGESYAGKYVPVFTHHLLQNDTFTSQIKIGGIGIGDGWSDPLYQVPTYSTFGYVTGLIDANGRDRIREKEMQAVKDILNGDYYQATGLANGILDNLAARAGGISEYDYREQDFGNPDPFSLWLNTTDAQSFLNIPFTSYEDCNSDVSDDFFSDNTQSIADVYPDLIAQIPVLLYNGQDDDNVDYEGVVNYINHLDWKDVKNFRQANRVPWKLSDGTTAGLVKGYGNFTFLLLFKAGHMVPTYQPKASAEMVSKFLSGTPLY